MSEVEQVLVVERSELERIGINQPGMIFEGALEKYNRLFNECNPSFKPRPDMEKDTRYKQIIPCLIIECEGKILSYTRGKASGEKRLIGNRTMFIGGHVNPEDGNPDRCEAAYVAGLKRESKEEIGLANVPGYACKPISFINDNSTEVAQVHLGIVHYLSVDKNQIGQIDESLADPEFQTVAELDATKDNFDSWGRLCYDNLIEIIRGYNGYVSVFRR